MGPMVPQVKDHLVTKAPESCPKSTVFPRLASLPGRGQLGQHAGWLGSPGDAHWYGHGLTKHDAKVKALFIDVKISECLG
jgi:hypothetical protein